MPPIREQDPRRRLPGGADAPNGGAPLPEAKPGGQSPVRGAKDRSLVDGMQSVPPRPLGVAGRPARDSLVVTEGEAPRAAAEVGRGRFAITPESRAGINQLRTNFEGLKEQYPYLGGMSFFGSRVKGQEGRNGHVSDYDAVVFVDAMPSSRRTRREWQAIVNGLEDGLEAPIDYHLHHETGAGLLIDTNRDDTEFSFMFFVNAARPFVDGEKAVNAYTHPPADPPTATIFSRFFLSGDPMVYGLRQEILDTFNEMPDGEKYLQVLMQSLAYAENMEKDQTSNPDYSKYPKSIAEAKEYFLPSAPGETPVADKILTPPSEEVDAPQAAAVETKPRYVVPEGAAFHDAWEPGETPHLIESTRLERGWGERLDIYNHFGAQKDRSLEEHQSALGFDPDEIPEGGSVLVIGSGLTRRFERELTEARPDVMVASIDPLLKFGVRERLREAIRMASSSTPPGIDGMGYGVRFPYELTDVHPYFKEGAFAGALAMEGNKIQGLPFGNGSFDQVVSMYSVPQYSRPEEVPFALSEAVRVMRTGATARFYPFFLEDLPALDSPDIQGKISEPVITKMKPYEVSGWGPDHRRVVFQKQT